jgi:hypothetical protein
MGFEAGKEKATAHIYWEGEDWPVHNGDSLLCLVKRLGDHSLAELSGLVQQETNQRIKNMLKEKRF